MLRRDFLKLVATGVAGLTAGNVRFGELVPFVERSEQILPGVSTWYATSCRECPAGCGLLARNREARATKAEGNPLHPINIGRLCARGQAALQGLYDPDRILAPRFATRLECGHRTSGGAIISRHSRVSGAADTAAYGALRKYATGASWHPIRRSGSRQSPAAWSDALAAVGRALAPLRGTGRVAVISDLQSGSLAALIREWLKAFGSDRYLVYEPFSYEDLREANRLVYGQAALPDYHFAECDFILSLAGDFVETWISPVKWIRRFAETRVPTADKMGKFVYAGPRVSLTAINADENVILAPGDERWLALGMLHVVVNEGLGKRTHPDLARASIAFAPETVGPKIEVAPDRIRGLARSFARARRPIAVAGAVVPGGVAGLEAAVAANLLNWAMGAEAVDFTRCHALGGTAISADISNFVTALGDGKVEAVLIIGANPVYALPPGYRFAEALRRVPTVVSIASFPDETAQAASWVLPANTPLECWGDYEPETGVANLMQPVMGALHDTRMPGDILLGLAEAAGVSVHEHFRAGGYYEYLRGRWAERGAEVQPGISAEEFWQQSMRQGGHWVQHKPTPAPAALQLGRFEFTPAGRARVESRSRADRLSLWVYPSTALFDGRGANRRWLQELPDVVHHAVWGTWVELHPTTAAQLGIERDDMVEVASPAGKIRAPAFIYKGMAPGAIAVAWGQGHTAYGRYAAKRGANPFALLDTKPAGARPFPDVRVTRRSRSEIVVTTDGATTQQRRNLFSAVLLSQLPRQRPEEIIWPLPEGYSPERDLYGPHPHVGHRWAMAVDATRCVGCEACMVACYAENNIAVVGKEWMAQGREMEWIWIERYYQWDSPHTPALLLPMLCQQCDAAPCESVCPVFAASHTEDGLNAQIYNRCIGTRYCNNNCPYKVRRFNWRNYDWPESLTWQLNPDVTVRSRGVMEKCTFCVQRIREVEQRAKAEGRPLRDGEVIPACAQTCPARAFTFGDLMDPDSRISQLVRGHPRRFQVLRDLNTKPAVIYLRKVINDTELA